MWQGKGRTGGKGVYDVVCMHRPKNNLLVLSSMWWWTNASLQAWQQAPYLLSTWLAQWDSFLMFELYRFLPQISHTGSNLNWRRKFYHVSMLFHMLGAEGLQIPSAWWVTALKRTPSPLSPSVPERLWRARTVQKDLNQVPVTDLSLCKTLLVITGIKSYNKG